MEVLFARQNPFRDQVPLPFLWPIAASFLPGVATAPDHVHVVPPVLTEQMAAVFLRHWRMGSFEMLTKLLMGHMLFAFDEKHDRVHCCLTYCSSFRFQFFPWRLRW